MALARSNMILDARNSSRRWISVTLRAKRVRKMASSIAESPPPMTAMSWSRKKNPSQVAQVLTPVPMRSCSPGTPRCVAAAPIARITDRAWKVSSPTVTVLTGPSRDTSSTSSMRRSAPKRRACSRISSISSGPVMPSLKPG